MMMNRFIAFIHKLLGTASALALAAGSFSCEHIYDYEGDCAPHYFVEFKFERNMLFADAFYAKVSSIDLYVFDARSGRFVDRFTESSDVLKTPGYRMPLDLEPGSYTFVAWGGTAHNEGRYALPAEGQIAGIDDLFAKMNRTVAGDQTHQSNTNLDYNTAGVPCALYHGRIEAELPDREGEHCYTVPLTKDTNNIIVSIWHRYGELNPAHYDIRLVYPEGESSATLGADNLPLTDRPVVYRPWDQRGGDLDLGDAIPGLGEEEGAGDADYDHPQGKFITAEISTSRLLADQNPRLVIYDTEAEEVRLDIPFIKYINAYRSANYKKMDNQEYLDRQDEYTVAIILDSSWAAFQLIIQGWHEIDNGDLEI